MYIVCDTPEAISGRPEASLRSKVFSLFGFNFPWLQVEGEGGAGGGGDPDNADLNAIEGLGDAGKRAIVQNRADMREAQRARKEAEAEAKRLAAQLEAFKDIDPKKAREAEDILARNQELEEAQSKLRADIESELQQTYETQLKQQQDLTLAAQNELKEYKLSTQLETVFYASDGLPGEFKRVAADLRERTRLDKDGLPEVLDAEGNPAYVAENGKSRPMTVAELIAEIAAKDTGFARHFKGSSDRPAFSLNGGRGVSANDPALANMSPWEILSLQRSQKR